jgi:hypothetical protein
MICPDCGLEMGDPVDTTYSNINTNRAFVGEHTGDIYYCEECEIRWLDDFLSGETVVWCG